MPAPAPSSLSVGDLLARVATLSGRLADHPSPPSATLWHQGQVPDFATQDYLGLATHPALGAAASGTLSRHRLLPSDGPNAPALAVQQRTAALLRLPHAATFASGEQAIRATLAALLAPGDEVILDIAADPAMTQAAILAGARPVRTPSASVEGVERRLRRLSGQRRQGRLWVAVPAISAHGAAVADLAEVSALCRLHGAGLVVDASHDLGAMGEHGGGVMELQGCLGRADVVLGSFAPSFGATGGFAAFRDPALPARLRRAGWRSPTLSPGKASAILAAFVLIDGAEGRRRRRRLHGNALRLRNHLMADGLPVMGQPAPFVPVRLPPATAQARSALLASAGPRLPLLQAPSSPATRPAGASFCPQTTASRRSTTWPS